MTIACSSSAFEGSLDEALDKISCSGIQYADLIGINGWNHIILSKLAEDFDNTASYLEKQLKKYSLKLAALNIAVAHLYLRDEETVQQRKNELKAAAAFMKQLGIKIASFYPGYKNEEIPRATLLENTAQTINEMLEIGKEYDISFAVEPHFATPFQTLSQIRELMAAVPHLPVAYDPSHFAIQGIDLRETEFLFDRTIHVHLRDAAPDRLQSPTGLGTVDFKWIIDVLRERRYDGFYSIEILPGDEIDQMKEISKMKDMLSRLLAK